MLAATDRRARWAPLVILMLLCVARSAAAAPDAATLVEQGKAAFADGDFARGRELLRQAARRTSAPRLLAAIHLHLGLIHAGENQREAALQAFRTALTHAPELELDPHRHKRAFVELFALARRETIGELVVEVAAPAGAELIVDGVVVKRRAFAGAVLAGAHHVALQLQGHTLESRGVKVLAGQRTRVALRAAATAAGPGTQRPPPAPRPRRRLATWLALGGAVASAAVGVALRVLATQDLEAGCELLAGASLPCEERSQLRRQADRPRYEELQRSLRAKDTGAVVAFGLAGALAVAVPLLYWLEGRAPRGERGAPPRRWSASPWTSRPGLSLQLTY